MGRHVSWCEATKHYQPRMNFLPTVLCMDEFKSMKSVSGSMSFICVDGTTNQLFTILEDRRLYKLTQYFLRFPRKARLKVKYLVMDMNASYCQLLKTVFPNAEIVTDRFHIVQHINRSFNQLRVQIMNRFELTLWKSEEVPSAQAILETLTQRFHDIGATQTALSSTV